MQEVCNKKQTLNLKRLSRGWETQRAFPSFHKSVEEGFIRMPARKPSRIVEVLLCHEEKWVYVSLRLLKAKGTKHRVLRLEASSADPLHDDP